MKKTLPCIKCFAIMIIGFTQFPVYPRKHLCEHAISYLQRLLCRNLEGLLFHLLSARFHSGLYAVEQAHLGFRLVFSRTLGVNLARLRVDDLEATVDWQDRVGHVSLCGERRRTNRMPKSTVTTVRIPLSLLTKKDCSFLVHFPTGLIEIRVRDVIRTLLKT